MPSVTVWFAFTREKFKVRIQRLAFALLLIGNTAAADELRFYPDSKHSLARRNFHMTPECQEQEYEGHRIELREREGKIELLIDNIPVRYGQHHDGMYFLDEYAYDPTDNLITLAQKFIDYRRRVDQIRRERESEKGRK